MLLVEHSAQYLFIFKANLTKKLIFVVVLVLVVAVVFKDASVGNIIWFVHERFEITDEPAALAGSRYLLVPSAGTPLSR